MKKLCVLILTFVMVFAIAAPAMAAPSWSEARVTGSPFVVTVDTYKLAYDAIGNPFYTELGNTAVVEGTPVAFKVTIEVPTREELGIYYFDIAALKPDLGVKLTNLSNVTMIGSSSYFTVIDDTKIEVALPGKGLPYDATVSATFTATVKNTDKALVEAYAGLKSPDDTGKVRYGDYRFENTADRGFVKNGPYVVGLSKNSNEEVTGWSLSDYKGGAIILPGPIFVVIMDIGPFKVGTVVTAADPLFDTLNKPYMEFTDFLGFDVTSTGIYFSDANIIANYAKGGYAKATGTFLPYTSSFTVTDSTSVPNTGDNMSVIGFVMIGLALLATAAVIVKKVRA